MDMVAKPHPREHRRRTDTATLGLWLIAASWGFNWPAVKLALDEMSVWGMRAVGLSIGAALLLLLARMLGKLLAIGPHDRRPLIVAGLLNVTGFNILTAFAQTQMPTSRAAILAYTMPLWAALLARIFLGERLTVRRQLALALGAAGLAIVVVPLVPMLREPGVVTGTLSILGAALSWAAGTVYVKRTPIAGDPIVTTGWQLAIGAVTAWAGLLIFEMARTTHGFWPTNAWGWGGLLYNAVIGVALSYFVWFSIVSRLPAASAAIGTLLVPVVGVVGAMAIIGERPSLFDAVGFLLIIAAVVVNLRGTDEGGGIWPRSGDAQRRGPGSVGGAGSPSSRP